MEIEVSGLFTYPVKSCRGIEHGSVAIGPLGLSLDREWMVVSAAGRFLSQREHPRLALVEVAFSGEGGVAREMRLSAPGMPPLTVPLGEAGRAPALEVEVWGDRVRAFDQGPDAADWLYAWLGLEARLVRFDPAVQRACRPVAGDDPGAHTRFADAYPLLVVGEASLEDLNRRLDAPLPMNRFRPNLVIRGLPAYEEDFLDTLDGEGFRLRLVKPCTRCQVTATDQDDARVGREPLVTLSRYRNNPDLGGVTFGMNAIVLGEGRLARGQRLAAAYRF